MKFRPFAEAMDYVHKLKLKNEHEWKRYCKSGKKPEDIPKYPKTIYKYEWRGLGDWLGTGVLSTHDRLYSPFQDAKKFVHSLNLKSQAEWLIYTKSENKPMDIPAYPNAVYKNDWKGWGDWLGTGNVAPRDIIYRPFEDAKKFVLLLKLRSSEDWKEYCKSGKKPADMPANPRQVYFSKSH